MLVAILFAAFLGTAYAADLKGFVEEEKASASNGGAAQKNQITEHQTCRQWLGIIQRETTVFPFLLFGAKEEDQIVALVELNQPRFVVSINNQEPAARLVVVAAEPSCYKVNDLWPQMQVLEVAVNAQTTQQNSGIVDKPFAAMNLIADFASAGIGQMSSENAGVGNGESCHHLVRCCQRAETIGLTKELGLIGKRITVKEFIDVTAPAVEILDINARCPQRQEDKFVEGHCAVSSLYSARDRSTMLIQRASAEASYCDPARWLALYSARSMKRSATSPVRTGTLLIARAIFSDV